MFVDLVRICALRFLEDHGVYCQIAENVLEEPRNDTDDALEVNRVDGLDPTANGTTSELQTECWTTFSR